MRFRNQKMRQLFTLPKGMKPGGLGDSLGKLAVVHPDLIDDPQPFEILDCYDQSLRDSGQMLLQSGGQLYLIRSDGVLTQTAERAGDFPADLAEGPVKAVLRGVLSPLRCLLSVGAGTLRRVPVALMDDERKTQVRAELWVLKPKGKGKSVTLATVQGLRGYDKARAALIAHLEGLGAQPGLPSDLVLERMYPTLARYVAKPDVAMTGEELAFQAANDIIAAYLQVARQNEAGVIADLDTEFLHDYRVALRKIRSVVSLFKGVYDTDQTARLKTTFSDLMAPTGRLRDLDVYLLDRQVYFDLVPDTLHDGLAVMFDLFDRERGQQLAALTDHFQSDAYAAQMADLQTLFATPETLAPGENAALHAHDYACALIWKRYRKVCKIAAGIDDQTEDEEVHELRIHCKKLRYLIEFFAPLFPRKEVKAVIKPLKKLQDNLGLFNDYSVQQQSLGAFLADHASKGRAKDLAIASSIGALIAVLHQRQLDERARVVASFAAFDSADTQARFRTLFHSTAPQKGATA